MSLRGPGLTVRRLQDPASPELPEQRPFLAMADRVAASGGTSAPSPAVSALSFVGEGGRGGGGGEGDGRGGEGAGCISGRGGGEQEEPGQREGEGGLREGGNLGEARLDSDPDADAKAVGAELDQLLDSIETQQRDSARLAQERKDALRAAEGEVATLENTAKALLEDEERKRQCIQTLVSDSEGNLSNLDSMSKELCLLRENRKFAEVAAGKAKQELEAHLAAAVEGEFEVCQQPSVALCQFLCNCFSATDNTIERLNWDSFVSFCE
jgi:hypothetical protein